jgi:hypothetical protein
MKKTRPILLKRFILSIICNNCGAFNPCLFVWRPDMSFELHCQRCNQAELMYLGPQKPIVEKKEDETLKLTEDETNLVSELLKKKTAKRIKN